MISADGVPRPAQPARQTFRKAKYRAWARLLAAPALPAAAWHSHNARTLHTRLRYPTRDEVSGRL